MALLIDRRRSPAAPPAAGGTRKGPVVLATLSVRVDPSAERMALESALEANVPLIVANMLAFPSTPMTLTFAPDSLTLPHEEDLEAVRATAARAAALGIPTQLLRINSRRPVRELLRLLAERDAGLIVFGPDRACLPKTRFRAAAWLVRRRATCLVWIAPDG